MRKEITGISPLRTGVIYAVLFAIVYLAMGLLWLLFAPMMGGFGQMSEIRGVDPGMAMGVMGAGGAVGMLFGAIMGAIFGFIGGVIVAVVYNLVAGITGGIIITLEDA